MRCHAGTKVRIYNVVRKLLHIQWRIGFIAGHMFVHNQVVKHIPLEQETTAMLIILHDTPVQLNQKTKGNQVRCDCESSVNLNAIRSTVCHTVNLNTRGSRTHQTVLVKHVVSSQKTLLLLSRKRRGEWRRSRYKTHTMNVTKKLRPKQKKFVKTQIRLH
jgi:hypothetical protein